MCCQRASGGQIARIARLHTPALVRVKCEAGVKKASDVYVIVVFNFIHVIGRIPDLHVQASIGHGLPLNLLTSSTPFANEDSHCNSGDDAYEKN